MDSYGEYFLFYGLTDFVIFSSGLKVWLLLLLSKILSVFLYPESWHGPRPICSRWRLFQKLIFLFPIPADGRSSHFRLRLLANHLASIFFLPLVTKCKHLSASTLTHILYFDLHYLSEWSFFDGLLLLIQIWRNSSNLISLLLMGDHVTMDILFVIPTSAIEQVNSTLLIKLNITCINSNNDNWKRFFSWWKAIFLHLYHVHFTLSFLVENFWMSILCSRM